MNPELHSVDITLHFYEREEGKGQGKQKDSYEFVNATMNRIAP